MGDPPAGCIRAGHRPAGPPALDPASVTPAWPSFRLTSAAGSATPPAAGAITDFCTPLKRESWLGVTGDNPDAPGAGADPVRTLPAAGTVVHRHRPSVSATPTATAMRTASTPVPSMSTRSGTPATNASLRKATADHPVGSGLPTASRNL